MVKRKQKGKFSKLLKKVSLNSSSRKLVAFVLVFAIIGGGYYLYKSFAATGLNGGVMPHDWLCYTPHPNQQTGSRGDCVKYIQASLVYYAGQKIAVDGIYGSATAGAVKNLQAFYKLPQTGNVDEATWEAVDSLIRAGDLESAKGVYRAACKNIKMSDANGKATSVISRHASSSFNTIETNWKNMGTYSWPYPGVKKYSLYRSDGSFWTDLKIQPNQNKAYISPGATFTSILVVDTKIDPVFPTGLYYISANLSEALNVTNGIMIGPDCRYPVYITD